MKKILDKGREVLEFYYYLCACGSCSQYAGIMDTIL